MGDEAEFSLVMPFIVCRSQGGPYDDAAFVAGCYFGEIRSELARPDRFVLEMTVPSPLVPQLDLVAMDAGFVMTAKPWDDHPDEWTFVRLTRPRRGLPASHVCTDLCPMWHPDTKREDPGDGS
jgi:hypothetical protein